MSSQIVRKFPSMYTFGNVLSTFVEQTTTHGIRKMTVARHPARKLFWVSVFFLSFSVCCYHCSHLISLYISAPKVTITEERDAYAMEFPALTLCNLNVIKKSFSDMYFEKAAKRKKNKNRKSENASGTCYRLEDEILEQSAGDLSDTWLNLGITRDNLSQYGHKAKDLIVQCTYNYKDCFLNNSQFMVIIENVTSPTFGLCHTLHVLDKKRRPFAITKAGVTLGLRLTLNIEREEYWDLISPEYGVRLLVHPQNTYPTLQRGGLVASPGTMVHIGVKRKLRSRLPGKYNSCTKRFEESELDIHLLQKGLQMDLAKYKYTYEYCNIICQNAVLLSECGCTDDLPRDVRGRNFGKFCDPCNKTQATCRSDLLRNFTDFALQCDKLCKPSCNSIRYDISLSQSSWPNIYHQMFVMRRSPTHWEYIQQLSGVASLFSSEEETVINSTFFRENLLRVHLYVTEMGYQTVEEEYNYKLPKLLADLGGCLGLYLGVSVISVIELLEFFGSIWIICLLKTKINGKHKPSVLRHTKKKRNKQKQSTEYSSYPPLRDKFYQGEKAKTVGKRELTRSHDSRWRYM